VSCTHGNFMQMMLMLKCAQCEHWSLSPCFTGVRQTWQALFSSRWTSRGLWLQSLSWVQLTSVCCQITHLLWADQQHTQPYTHHWLAEPGVQVLGTVWYPLFPLWRMSVQDLAQRLDCCHGSCLGRLVSGWSTDYVLLLLLSEWQPWAHGWLWSEWCEEDQVLVLDFVTMLS